MANGATTLTLAYDITPLLDSLSGVGHYTRSLLAALTDIAPHDRRLLYAKAPPPNPVAAGPPLPPYFPRSHAVWLQWHLARQLRRQRPHLAHFTNEIAPLAPGCPVVLSLHDASLFRHPKLHPWRRRLSRRWLIPLCARQATAVLTGTRFARDELCRYLPLDPARVSVVPYAAAARFTPAPEPDDRERARAAGLPERFVLALAPADPRKNIVTLLKAIALLRRQGHDIVLVLAGRAPGPHSPAGRALADPALDAAVHLLGHVDDQLLPLLYRRATCLAYPSLYEGFGLPILEAMASGTPVVTSTGGATAEVAGGAALLHPAHSVEELATAVERLWRDAPWRAQWRQKGLARAAQFSWEKCAMATRDVYRAVAAGRVTAPTL